MLTTEQMQGQVIQALSEQYGITLPQARQMYRDLQPVIGVREAKKYIQENFK